MTVITVLVKLMIKSILKYLWWSDVIFTINLHPRHWRFIDFRHQPRTDFDPHMRAWIIKVLMFKLTIIIDDGTW